jgi:hypothetical protein
MCTLRRIDPQMRDAGSGCTFLSIEVCGHLAFCVGGPLGYWPNRIDT